MHVIILKLRLLHWTVLPLPLLVLVKTQLSTRECHNGFHLLASSISFHSLTVAKLFTVFPFMSSMRSVVFKMNSCLIFFFLKRQKYRLCFVFVYCNTLSYTCTTPTIKKMLRWPVSTGYSVVKLKNKIGLDDKSEFLWLSNL